MAVNLRAGSRKSEFFPGRPVKNEMPFHIGMPSDELFQEAKGIPPCTLQLARNKPSRIDRDAQGGFRERGM